jgi:ATP-dependent helicase/DNAse subunit B
VRLLTGPAGSGKTTYVVEQLRQAVRSGDQSVRLLVPTATMAQHLQNRLAREGLVFRRGLIQTFSGFVEAWTADLPQVSEAALYLIVEEAARRVNRPEFARVVEMRGFCASLARTIAEFSSAGCDSRRLAAHLPEGPLSDAFLAVYREVDRQLAVRGLSMRARRLEAAADRIAAGGMPGIATVWLDGFHALPDPELAVIRAMTKHAEVVLVRTDGQEQSELAGWPVSRFAKSRPSPALMLVKAPNIEREAEEIARRILEQSSAGHPFRDMAIIVRNPDTYVPVLRAVLDRFGIPARFYFDGHLQEHAAIRFLCGAVHAMLSGWEHTKTMAVLRLAPRFAESSDMDRLDFAVREQIPNAGLGPLKALLVDDGGKPRSPGCERLLHKLDSLAALEEWQQFALTPKEWAGRFRTLRNLFRVGEPADRDGRAMVELHRSQAAALDAFDEALDATAGALDPRHAIGIAAFFHALESVLRITPLRIADQRRNVVQVLSAPEARQWVLPLVFICGMVEKEFPSFHTQDPFFPDAARCELNRAGIRVRTAAEFEREERALFDSAITRATAAVTLTYPEFNARGDRNLPSLYLEHLFIPPSDSRTVKPRPRHILPPRPPAQVHSPALLQELRRRTGSISPTAVELYLQCAFQHFAGRLLRLKTAPPRPAERLNFMTQGQIVHEVLRTWWAAGGNIEPVFEDVFAAALEKEHIPCVYHTERLRNAMLDDLREFVAGDKWPRGMFESRTEEQFDFMLEGGVQIRGKIDRLDVAGGRAYVIDYKYSNAQNTKSKLNNADLVQAPMYLMAAERVFGLKPAGMFYVGLKRGPVYAGWSEDGLMDGQVPDADWLGKTEKRVLEIVDEIRGGRIEVLPSDPDKCRFCDFADACRVQVQVAVDAPEEAETA